MQISPEQKEAIRVLDKGHHQSLHKMLYDNHNRWLCHRMEPMVEFLRQQKML